METFNDIIESMEDAVNTTLLCEGIFNTQKDEKQWQELKPNTIITIKGKNITGDSGYRKDSISGVDINQQKHQGLELFATSLSDTMIGKDENGKPTNRIVISTGDAEKYIYFVYRKKDGTTATAIKDTDLGLNPSAPMLLLVSLSIIPAKVNDFNEHAISIYNTIEQAKKERRELTAEEQKTIQKSRDIIHTIKSNAKTIESILGYNPLAAPGKRGEITFDFLKKEIADCVCDTAFGLLSPEFQNKVQYIKPILERLTNVNESSIKRIRLPNEPANMKQGANLTAEDVENIKSQALSTFKQALAYINDENYKSTRLIIYIKVPQ